MKEKKGESKDVEGGKYEESEITSQKERKVKGRKAKGSMEKKGESRVGRTDRLQIKPGREGEERRRSDGEKGRKKREKEREGRSGEIKPERN